MSETRLTGDDGNIGHGSMADPHIRVPWYLLIMVVVLPVMFTAVGMSISLKSAEKSVNAEAASRRSSELAFCQLLSVLDGAYKSAPPTTPTGQKVALAVANLLVANRCP